MTEPLAEQQARALMAAAAEAMRVAYAPYSKFHVGAALLTGDGRVFTGANVENSSYGLTVCAERVAVFKAVSEGVRDFRAIAVTCSGDEVCAPCGACRQVLYEFGPDLVVLLGSPAQPARHTLAALLPLGFRLPR